MLQRGDEQFVEVLYTIFFDRASDADGKAFRLGKLNNGVSKQTVVNGFTRSEEFLGL